MVSAAFEKLTLSNGLDVIVQEDHSLPIVAVNVWYHVGSKDEEVGRTGFAHLFEHLMFEGSKNHNSSHFEPLQRVGADLNGSTNTDRTNYWENVPSNCLELALWLEADRMGFLLDVLNQERFDVQRDVVKNERRQSYENRPYGMASALIQSTLFPLPHPYNWWTIGSQEDLDAATLDDVKTFFRKFYAPSNASLAIVGDIQSEEVKRLVDSYFSDIPPGPSLSRTKRMESDLGGVVDLTMRDKVQLSRLYLAWPVPPRFDVDEPPLTMLSSILGGGKSSRLYRSLVHEKQIAQDVVAFYSPAEIAGEFILQVTAAPGHTIEEVYEAAETELERLRREPPTAEEVDRVKNRMESRHYRLLERVGGFGGRADLLNSFNVLGGDPALANSDLERFLAVGAEDIHRVTNTALGSKMLRLSVLPEASLTPSVSVIDRSIQPTPSKELAFQPPTPERGKLPNGLQVLVLQKRELPLVVFGLLLPAGGVTDPQERPGLANLTASMLSEGTKSRTSQQITDEFEFMGSQLGISTSHELVFISAETLTKFWPKALEMLADVTQNPTFPETELERIRKERLTNLSRIKDEPTAIAGRVTPLLLYGKGTPYGHPGTGTEESIGAITREELLTHFNDHYGPQGATLVVVGDVTLEEVLSRAEAELGEWTGGLGSNMKGTSGLRENSHRPTTIFLVDKPSAAQSVIRAGQVTVPRHHEDYYALTLLDYSFGGQFSARLNMNLRQDKGYSYGYRSWIEWQTPSSLLIAGGGVQTAVTKESVEETLKEFAGIRGERPLTESEFDDAKAGLLRGFASSFETVGHILGHLIQIALFDLPDDYYSTLTSSIEAVTLDDVHRVAAERIDDRHLTLLVVGDRNVVEPGLKELGLPIVHLDFEGEELPAT